MAEESLVTIVIWLLTATFPAHAGISASPSATEAVKSNAPPGSNERTFADLYDAFMDEAAIEARAMRPLQPPRTFLDSGLLRVYSEHYVPCLLQGGLEMPSPDYCFEQGEFSAYLIWF